MTNVGGGKMNNEFEIASKNPLKSPLIPESKTQRSNANANGKNASTAGKEHVPASGALTSRGKNHIKPMATIEEEGGDVRSVSAASGSTKLGMSTSLSRRNRNNQTKRSPVGSGVACVGGRGGSVVTAGTGGALGVVGVGIFRHRSKIAPRSILKHPTTTSTTYNRDRVAVLERFIHLGAQKNNEIMGGDAVSPNVEQSSQNYEKSDSEVPYRLFRRRRKQVDANDSQVEIKTNAAEAIKTAANSDTIQDLQRNMRNSTPSLLVTSCNDDKRSPFQRSGRNITTAQLEHMPIRRFSPVRIRPPLIPTTSSTTIMPFAMTERLMRTATEAAHPEDQARAVLSVLLGSRRNFGHDHSCLFVPGCNDSVKPKINEENSAKTNSEAAAVVGPSTSTQQAEDDKDKEEDKDPKKKKNRCAECRKKVGLTGFQCRCGGLYCAVHRYSDKHDCTFNYREHGAQEIRRNNPVVVGEKIQKI